MDQKQNNSHIIEDRDYFLRRRVVPMLVSIALFIGVFLGVVGYGVVSFFANSQEIKSQNYPNVQNNIESFELDTDLFDNVIQSLRQNYLYELPTDLTYNAIKGVVSSLNDPYTSFLTPKEAEEYMKGISGEFEGIGVVLGQKDSFVIVETVMEGRPAQNAGVRNGDLILKVDGNDITGKTPSEAAQLIRGPKGSKVKLELLRNTSEELSIELERQTIEIDSISWKRENDNTAVIDILQFSDSSAFDFNTKWDSIVDEISSDPNIVNLVIDLRNNPGGYVFSVKYVLEEFMKSGTVLFKEKEKNKSESEIVDRRVGVFEDMNLVVLVNEGSASASEIFASSIQDNKRGKVIGQKTVGKGVEQQLLKQSDGSILILVFQQWLSPNSRSISKESPIVPDIQVEDNPETSEDEQFKAALKELLGKF